MSGRVDRISGNQPRHFGYPLWISPALSMTSISDSGRGVIIGLEQRQQALRDAPDCGLDLGRGDGMDWRNTRGAN